MKSLRFTAEGAHGLVAAELPLRMPQASGVVDPEPFRVRSVAGPMLAEPFALSGGMRTLHVDPVRPADLFDSTGPLLTFVISGEVRVATAAAGDVVLEPGDLFLCDAAAADAGSFAPAGDCRLIQLQVEPDWPGDRARPPRADSAHPRGSHPLNLKRMDKGADERSYFREFANLFGPPGRWSAVTPLTGFRFIGMAEDTFIDWHPEIVNNFVIVMSGALELETGGGGGEVQVFRQGDVCLAADRTGEGHIDRVHGYVQVAVLILEDEDLWL